MKEENRHLLLVDMHHIISDGFSHRIFLKDLMALYREEELPPLRRELIYHIDIPESARLRFGVGMNPDTWTNFLEFALAFTVRVDGGVVFEERLDPRRDFDDRKWAWADLPLAAGPHTVGFEIRTDNAFGAVGTVSGWARPRVVLERNYQPASPVTSDKMDYVK